MSKAIDQARRAANRMQQSEWRGRVAIEVRAASADGSIPVAGHAALYNTRSQPLYDLWEGRFVEVIAPGAFTRTLKNAPDVTFNIDHDNGRLLARTTAGTLRLTDDGAGLAVDADMAPTTVALDLAEHMRRGNITQMSFAFQAIEDDWDETDEGTPIRTLREVKLFDVAAVVNPAYEQTDIGLRSREARALLHAFGLLDTPADQRAALLRALTTDATPDDALLPVLRSAQEALAALVARAAPATSHADGLRDPLAHWFNRGKAAQLVGAA